MVCPSDDSLRRLLHNAEQETSSTDVLSHLAGCPACMDRVSTWNERSRLDTLLRGAGQSDIAIAPASRVVIPGGVEALTCAYAPGTAPLRMIGPYEILRPIGSGGGGDVFEARHTLLQNRVAIKLLKPKHSGDQDARQRFFREMKSIGQLDDPYIVRAFDAGEVDGTLYLAMELVDGENVDALARRLAPVPVADACEIIRQAALGLQHVHECGLVHRDLKPSNLLMSKTGVKIADLGLALLKRGELIEERLTGVHTVLGTADYMAPEQAEGSHEVDIRADLYSLGCTLFRLLTGRTPFAMPENSSPVKKMWAHASLPIPEIQQFRPDVPPELAAVVTKLMAKHRNDRFAQPKDLAEALAPFCTKPDLPSLMLPLGMIARVAIGNNSTAKDPTEPLANPSAASHGTELQTHATKVRRPRTVAVSVAVVAGVLAALGWWGIHAASRSDRDAQARTNSGLAASTGIPPKSPAIESPTTLTAVNPAANVLPVAAVQVPAVAAPDSPLTQQWQKVFGIRPTDVTWQRRSGLGAWRLDDDLKSLVIHGNRTIRLVQLGELQPDAIGKIRLGVDISIRSDQGSFGFFLGFRQNPDDPERAAVFQVVEVMWLNVVDSNRRVVVQRYLGSINSENGTVGGKRDDFVSLTVPMLHDKLRLEIELENHRLSRVVLNELNYPKLCADPFNAQYFLEDYCGAFGVYAADATVEFRNPSMTRDP